MVTIVRGTKRSHNGALKIAATIAAMSAYDLHRKTLILQIANNLSDIAYELAGHMSSDEEKAYGFENNNNETGIDALLARAATGSITEKQFDALVDPISKEKHELDVAATTNTDITIEYTISENLDTFRQILESAAGDTEADAPYDNVIIVANGKNEELLALIRPFVDNEVVCVGQNAAEFKEAEENKESKRIIVVNDFSEESVYNLRYMKKEYKSQNVYPMPHNILLSDATNSGRISSYIAENLQVDASNVNFAVIDSLRKINNFLFMEKAHDNSDKLKGLKGLSIKKSHKEKIKLYTLPDGSVTVNETEVKKFLRKPRIDKSIEIDTENLDGAEDIEYEDFGVNEQYLEDREEDLKRTAKAAKKKKSKAASDFEDGEDMDRNQKDYLKKQRKEMEQEKKTKKKGGLFGLFGKKDIQEEPAKEELEEEFEEEFIESEPVEDFDDIKDDTYTDEKAESDAYERDIVLEEVSEMFDGPEDDNEAFENEEVHISENDVVEEDEHFENIEDDIKENDQDDDFNVEEFKSEVMPERKVAEQVHVDNTVNLPSIELADGEYSADDLLDAMLGRK